MDTENQQKPGFVENVWTWVKGVANKIVNAVFCAQKEAKKLAKDDPRRVVHSFKVGLAIILVSLLYYFDDPIYDGFGVSAMWAVMTVVVIFEFSVGATLGKGVNRGIASLLGGALGVGAHRLASFTGNKVEPIFLGLSVFLMAAVSSFLRFHPLLKARYDYGLMIFILTVSLICVSGYRDDEVLDIAYIRLFTVLIGGAASVFICVVIRPVWAGEDLHNLTAANIEKLAIFFQGTTSFLSSLQHNLEFFKSFDESNEEKKASLDVYKSVLNSKANEESLANSAKWEPRHGKFRYRQPWDQYLKVGAATRECAYRIEALSGYLINSEMQMPAEIREKIQEPCMKISKECSCALVELSAAIKKMTQATRADLHVSKAKAVSKNLKSLLKTGLSPDTDLVDIIPAATVASLLLEIVSCTAQIADSVHELALLSKYKCPDDARPSPIGNEKILPRTSSIEVSRNFVITVV
ncbi:Aluminum activated malate transporter family protein [Dorcoceras hygrometricum]|uniref:Aluminum activated malate transporter family protein n=1 Tax=Dorcoceras hygrometricum TaxID=472368 RepID=A0A2Z7DAT6_9LAMI|nr:Aluminum activated malate transporter family protein [Dorcoceras hygrometricum]